MSDEEILHAQRAVVERAMSILEGRLDVLEGCKQLSAFGHQLLADRFDDEDFSLFDSIASESDNLPTGTARQYWSPEALEREDRGIASYEAIVREQVHAACRNVLARFNGQPSANV
jgi:hypothetical protein